MTRARVAIIGSGNIGTDLMIKVLRLSDTLEMAAMVGIDPASDGLARAGRLGVPTSALGVDGLVAMPAFGDIDIVFDATSAGAHKGHWEALGRHGKRVVDLTPAALGPYAVPAVNGDVARDAENVSLVTCGGQATIPIVAASRRSPMPRSWRRSRADPRGRARGPTSTSPRRRPRGRSRRWAAPIVARPSSSSIRQSRR